MICENKSKCYLEECDFDLAGLVCPFARRPACKLAGLLVRLLVVGLTSLGLLPAIALPASWVSRVARVP